MSCIVDVSCGCFADITYIRASVYALCKEGASEISYKHLIFVGAWNKWNIHFIEMKGCVGMACHEKEREQVDA